MSKKELIEEGKLIETSHRTECARYREDGREIRKAFKKLREELNRLEENCLDKICTTCTYDKCVEEE